MSDEAQDDDLELGLDDSATPAHQESGWPGFTAASLDELLGFLLASTLSESEAAWASAEDVVTAAFESPRWGVDRAINPFTPEGRPNLYRNEIPGDFRTWLEQQGIGEQQYVNFVKEIQYNSIQIWLEKLFPKGQKSNRGWRIRVIGFPSLKTIALGLSGNYQGSQAQNQIGAASAMIRGAALDVLATDFELKSLMTSYPSATSEHWDDSGLMPVPVLSVGDLDISSYGGARERPGEWCK